MMRYLSLMEVLELHRQIIERSGGASDIRNLGLLKSAIAQPLMTFGGEDLYQYFKVVVRILSPES